MLQNWCCVIHRWPASWLEFVSKASLCWNFLKFSLWWNLLSAWTNFSVSIFQFGYSFLLSWTTCFSFHSSPSQNAKDALFNEYNFSVVNIENIYSLPSIPDCQSYMSFSLYLQSFQNTDFKSFSGSNSLKQFSRGRGESRRGCENYGRIEKS